MILLLNVLLPVLLSIIFIFGLSRFNKEEVPLKKGKIAVKTLIVMVLVFYVYSLVQPSYIPKGVAPKMGKVPIETIERKPIEDLSVGRTDVEREERKSEILTYRQEVKQLIKENKDEKEGN